MITTEAWVLHAGPDGGRAEPGRLVKEDYSFPDIDAHEVLAEPIYGCWEANMSHALLRQPIDVCRQRGEEKVVLGNAGVVRIVRTGGAVTNVEAGQFCSLAPVGSTDRFGYLGRVVGYDAPGTIGLLARQIKLHEKQVIPLPQPSRHSLCQWAAFSLRYPTAWANWKVAIGCWRLQMPEELCPTTFVWGWGGGVTLAELTLAKQFGCRAAMLSSSDERLALIERLGLRAVDRRGFGELDFDAACYSSDLAYRRSYAAAEESFLAAVRSHTGAQGASIFIDNIGQPVYRATLRALGNQGVLSTVGWKKGMELSTVRALECIRHHVHVFTHGARYAEGLAAIQFAEETGWMPPVDGPACGWDDIPELADAYGAEKIASYFPVFQVNPE